MILPSSHTWRGSHIFLRRSGSLHRRQYHDVCNRAVSGISRAYHNHILGWNPDRTTYRQQPQHGFSEDTAHSHVFRRRHTDNQRDSCRQPMDSRLCRPLSFHYVGMYLHAICQRSRQIYHGGFGRIHDRCCRWSHSTSCTGSMGRFQWQLARHMVDRRSFRTLYALLRSHRLEN